MFSRASYLFNKVSNHHTLALASLVSAAAVSVQAQQWGWFNNNAEQPQKTFCESSPSDPHNSNSSNASSASSSPEDGISGGSAGGIGGSGGAGGGAGAPNVKRKTTDYHKLRQSDADKEQDNKTTFYGQCLSRQLYRPKLPYPAWDYDWDHRETDATSQQAMSTENQFAKSKSLGKTRHLLLIRHGQYDERYKDDRRRRLTPLGRHQAELTGQRLALYARGGLGNMKREFSGPLNIKCIHVSDMERAKETARIIHSHLPHVKMNEPDPMLNEALPAPMIPIRPDIRAVREIDANHSRIEAAFQKYVHRADAHEEIVDHAQQYHHHHSHHPDPNPAASPQHANTPLTAAHHQQQHHQQHHHQQQHHQQQQQPQQQHPHHADHPHHPHGGGIDHPHHDDQHHMHHAHYHNDLHFDDPMLYQQAPHPEHEFEIFVGHGNVIRYFFCRALQLPPEAWLRISTFNCSITYLMIYPNGYVSCRMLGDVGHLGYDNTTFSGSHGYNW